MDNQSYPSNSFKSKEEKKEAASERHIVKSVVKGNVQQGRKSIGHLIKETFTPGDISDVKSYIIKDVIIPSIKTALSDVIKNGSDILLFGESGSRRNANVPAGRVSYGRYYEDKNRRETRRIEEPADRAPLDYNNISFDNRADAEVVLSTMDDMIATYGLVRVSEFYDLCGITPEFTENKWGWSNIVTAKIVYDRGKYYIRMPKASRITD